MLSPDGLLTWSTVLFASTLGGCSRLGHRAVSSELGLRLLLTLLLRPVVVLPEVIGLMALRVVLSVVLGRLGRSLGLVLILRPSEAATIDAETWLIVSTCYRVVRHRLHGRLTLVGHESGRDPLSCR